MSGGHGGRRAGCGRKPKLRDPIRLTSVFEPVDIAKIDRWCRITGLSRSEVIRLMIRRARYDQTQEGQT
jgi:hypothetical protein